MKPLKSLKICLIAFFGVLSLSSFTGSLVVPLGQWKITVSPDKKSVSLFKNGKPVLDKIQAKFRLNEKQISTNDYSIEKVSKTIKGKTTIVSILYKSDKYPELVRRFYIDPAKDYVETDILIKSQSGLASNYMAPVVVEDNNIFGGTADSRAIFVPFDNDKWVRFQSHSLDFQKLTSYEVTAIFDNQTRKGLIVGSVEHDTWKTGIEMASKDKYVTSLTCFGGIADELTRDSRPHGMLKGTAIKSPRVFIGYYADWRSGLEAYADANAAITPPRPWNKSVPFGWNSWGVLQFNLNYQKAIEVSGFFKNKLQNNHFRNGDKTVYIGLDSGWNSFSEEQLKAFVDTCRANGQVAGIYWTPFADWGKNPEISIHDAPAYKFKDVYLYANGKPQDLDGAYAIDPTHPAIEAQMKKTSELFRRCGFKYVKMDFMTHGSLEADHWFKPQVTTGIQAYNYGMKLLDKYFGDMFINLSISPIFPANYAQSRRIACDAWNKIKDTEYTLNAVSYGWWIDRVYQFNDADHVVLQQASDGENRARVTSAVITGLFINGDDFSAAGSEEGKIKACTFLTNPEINALAKGESFRPLEGNGERSEDQFIHADKAGNVYFVAFNYTDSAKTLTIPMKRMGVNPKEFRKVKELWSGDLINLETPLLINAKDVKIIKLER